MILFLSYVFLIDVQFHNLRSCDIDDFNNIYVSDDYRIYQLPYSAQTTVINIAGTSLNTGS